MKAWRADPSKLSSAQLSLALASRLTHADVSARILDHLGLASVAGALVWYRRSQLAARAPLLEPLYSQVRDFGTQYEP
jgi:hypothetical protein